MKRTLNILLVALAIVKLGQAVAEKVTSEEDTASVPPKPNLKVIFLRDLVSYLRYHPDVHITPFKYDRKEGFTLGEKRNNKLFSLEYEFDKFRNDYFIRTRYYTHPGNGTLNIQHVQLYYKNSTKDRNVFLMAGGIGQSFVSLLVEVADTNEPSLKCYINVSGEISDAPTEV